MAEPLPNRPDMEPLTRIEILGYMGVTAVILLLVAKVWQHLSSVSLLPLSPTGWALPWGVGVGLAITAASSIVYRLWPAYRQSADFYLALVLKPLEWPDLLWLGLLPGMSEELLFRGVMLSDLGMDTTALVISSLCFGILHFSGPQQWSYVIWATLVGLALGYSALATGNLLVPIVAHILTNWISGCVWKLGNGKNGGGAPPYVKI
ncbi:MAG: CPBP family intramembrane metalloprotease [Oscillatoria princeps RMCB-10]|nr:CPBP family intramembrane metalloprotease [Oscillatoria princeps RMCB-10]